MEIKKGITSELVIPFKYLEAASGFEPLNHGFADQCLSHLATPPRCGEAIYHSFNF